MLFVHNSKTLTGTSPPKKGNANLFPFFDMFTCKQHLYCDRQVNLDPFSFFHFFRSSEANQSRVQGRVNDLKFIGTTGSEKPLRYCYNLRSIQLWLHEMHEVVLTTRWCFASSTVNWVCIYLPTRGHFNNRQVWFTAHKFYSNLSTAYI